jgi:dienelactone hydrolase
MLHRPPTRRRIFAGLLALMLLGFTGVVHAGQVSDVTFPSNVPERPTEAPHQVRAKLYLPDKAKASMPAMVISPSSAGVKEEREIHYAQALNKAGIAALVVDSFASRGLRRGDTTMLSAWPPGNDAVAALRWLIADGRFDRGRIGVMGVSKGGVVAMNTAEVVRRRWMRMDDVQFAAHVAIVPNCHVVNQSLRTTGAPIFFMLAELDDLVPARFCVEHAKRLRDAGNSKIEVKVYKGAHHAWECITAKPIFDPNFANTSRCRVAITDEGSSVATDGTVIPVGGLNDWMRKNCMFFRPAFLWRNAFACPSGNERHDRLPKKAWVLTRQEQRSPMREARGQIAKILIYEMASRMCRGQRPLHTASRQLTPGRSGQRSAKRPEWTKRHRPRLASGALLAARHMWNGPQCKGFFSRFHHAGTVRSYVRPLCAAYDRWPR